MEAATIQKAMGAIMPVAETPVIRVDITEIRELQILTAGINADEITNY